MWLLIIKSKKNTAYIGFNTYYKAYTYIFETFDNIYILNEYNYMAVDDDLILELKNIDYRNEV